MAKKNLTAGAARGGACNPYFFYNSKNVNFKKNIFKIYARIYLKRA